MASSREKQKKVQNVRLPFIGSMTNRDTSGSKDQRFINIFPETRKIDQIESTKIFMNKRPGMSLYKDYGTGEGRGCIYFNGKFYIAVGNTLYEDGVTPTAKITFSGSTGHVGMTLGNSSTLGDYLFVCDGTDGWYINTSGTVTTMSNTEVKNVVVTSGGTSYAVAPTITFSAPGTGTTATGTAVLSSGILTGVTITNNGSGYSTAPTVTVTPYQTSTFDAATAWNTTTSTLTLTAHGFATADKVTYKTGGGTAPTTNPAALLDDGDVVYVIKVDDNSLKLATSETNANAGTAIDVTATGSGSGHYILDTPDTSASCTAYLNNFPTPHVPTPVFIDGYIALPVNSDIYSCDLDAPRFWSAGNFISAEMFPDQIKALARQNNQIVVLGSSSIEFFYDAANPSGSPFSRNESTANQMGTGSPYAVYMNENYLLFVGQSESGGRTIWKVEGFQPKRVSDEFVDRVLDSVADPTTIRGYGVRTQGHLFYVLNLPSINRTLVYDLDEKLWHEWSTYNAGNHSVFAYNYVCDNGAGAVYLLHVSDGSLYKLDPSLYQDAGTTIITEIVTNKYDMDTIKRKFASNLRWVGDSYSSNSVDVRWTDDDYQTWSNWKTINIDDSFPSFARLGCFRRRAFNWRHTGNTGLRGESFEITYQEGDS